MASIKRIILTRTQLNEIMDNMKTNVTFTGSTPTEMGANAKQEYNDAIGSGLKSNAIAFTGKSPRNNATDSTEANISINTNTPDIGKAVTDAVTNYVNNGGDINKVNVTGNAEDITNGTTDESKTFSKKQIEEARLKKIHEGYKITKRKLREHWEEKPNDDANQWNEEYEMFMDGLRHGDYEVMNDVLFVQVFKGRTPDNDPRYVYIRKGENRLHDDHLYIQNSPPLNDLDLKDIYYNAGWEDVLPELIDYDGFEMYESKNKIEINPKNKGKFTATKKRTGKSTEELTHSKNPLTRKRANFAKMAKRHWKPLKNSE